MKFTIKSFWPAVILFIIATVLLCLPGDEFPKKSWLDKIYFDKWVHVGLFATLVLAWSLPTIYRIKTQPTLKKALIGIAAGFIVYGIIIEIIQGRYIPFRSFSVDDMVADAIGCGLGFFLANRQTKYSD